jgi:4-hydroxyphenylacetate 3-monooxygenase
MPAGSEQTTRFIQEKLALLACYREGINAHLTAAVAMAEESPGGLLTPNQSLL